MKPLIREMKIFKTFILVIVAILFIKASGKNRCRYLLSGDYMVAIEGTSNLHNWEENVGRVSGEGMVNWRDEGCLDLESMSIKMDVLSIKSDAGFVMDNTYK